MCAMWQIEFFFLARLLIKGDGEHSVDSGGNGCYFVDMGV